MNVINLSFTEESSPDKPEIDVLKGYSELKFHGPNVRTQTSLPQTPNSSFYFGKSWGNELPEQQTKDPDKNILV